MTTPDIPATGGRFLRDPKTGALTPLPEEDAAPADSTETPEAPPATPAEADAPATTRKGKAS